MRGCAPNDDPHARSYRPLAAPRGGVFAPWGGPAARRTTGHSRQRIRSNRGKQLQENAMTRTIRHSVIAAATIVLLGTASEAAVAQTKCTSTTCGVVDRIDLVEKKGQGSGLGMIAGGVVGGVLGHQIGSGRGNSAATILGVGAGAYVGNEIEKNSKESS